ncbi:MAG: flavodoxin-dependent (E)-4-hydroxy-3-methylbut-2-enyl-diphosphate synthase [Chloroflexota bacterium]
MEEAEVVFPRRRSRVIYAGSVAIGGDNPVSVQTMTKTKTADWMATAEQINRCADAGADLVRVTVNDMPAAEAMQEIIHLAKVPVVADIHFNHIYAIKAMEAGVAKVRINPGNIGSRARIEEVLGMAKDRGIPIRIGVNSGSLEKDILERHGAPTADALYESAMRHAEIAVDFGFEDLAISVKSTSVPLMIAAYRLIASKTDFPLHLGVTEAGTLRAGTIKSCIGIGALLAEGIGDTIRVSLTDDPVLEVETGLELLRSLGLRRRAVELISCPTCGRLEVDLIKIATELERRLAGVKKSVKVAVMGCAVNGPGEAREADIGVACGRREALLFRRGEVLGKIPENEIIETVYREVMKF